MSMMRQSNCSRKMLNYMSILTNMHRKTFYQVFPNGQIRNDNTCYP